MRKQRLPICSLIKEIKDNNYSQQAKVKSRIKPSWRKDTEVEGSVATERGVTQKKKNSQLNKRGNTAQYSHKRKPSANIPYKMSTIHTNIGNLWINDKNEFSSEQINCQYNNNIEEDYDDEEWNVGGEAEETPYYPYEKKQIQAYPKKAVGGYDRHFRSSTTKSGSSSIGRYKHIEVVTHNAFSTEDDDENFMTLECDENLYDDDHLNENPMEEEKVAIHPTKIKQSFIDLQNYKKTESKSKKESVNDTIPDFGFIGKNENESQVSNCKKHQVGKVSVTKNDKPSNKLK